MTRLGASEAPGPRRLRASLGERRPAVGAIQAAGRRPDDQVHAVRRRAGDRARTLCRSAASSTAAGSRTVTSSAARVAVHARGCWPRRPAPRRRGTAERRRRGCGLSPSARRGHRYSATARGSPRRADRRSGPPPPARRRRPGAARRGSRAPQRRLVDAVRSLEHEPQARGAGFDRAQVAGAAERADPAERRRGILAGVDRPRPPSPRLRGPASSDRSARCRSGTGSNTARSTPSPIGISSSGRVDSEILST